MLHLTLCNNVIDVEQIVINAIQCFINNPFVKKKKGTEKPQVTVIDSLTIFRPLKYGDWGSYSHFFDH